MVTSRIVIIIMLLGNLVVRAAIPADTLIYKLNRSYGMGNIQTSANGRFLTLRKLYSGNNDSTMVFNIENQHKHVGTLVRKYDIKYCGDVIFSFGEDTAEIWNTKTDNKVNLLNIKKIEILGNNQYVVLDGKENLIVYDEQGTEKNKVSGIKNFYKNTRYKQLWVQTVNNRVEVLSDFKKWHLETIYSTPSKITKFSISTSEKNIQLETTDKETNLPKIVLIDAKTYHSSEIGKLTDDLNETFYFDEIDDTSSYFIVGTTKINKPTNPDIWYGNSGRLIDNELGYELRKRYWVWNPKTNIILSLPYKKFSSVSFLNDFYFIGFNKDQLQTYTTNTPNIEAHLINAPTGEIFNLGVVKEGKLYSSGEGAYIAFQALNEQWILLNTTTKKRRAINDKGFSQAVFSSDNHYLYFETNDGLWKYNIKTNSLSHYLHGTGSRVKILSEKLESSSPFVNAVKNKKALLLEVFNKDSLKTEYQLYDGTSIGQLLYFTKNRISSIHPEISKNILIGIEENYNIPPQLFIAKLSEKKVSIVHKSSSDRLVLDKLKIKIVHFTNSEGVQLKGLLYYPFNYSPNQKFPMIVRIYKTMSDKLNQYYAPEFSATGFDLITLLQNGYFVFLPDIVNGRSGAGLSALDCVNKSLDAVSDDSSINFEKLGLIGHSFGGYETNFIATHSNRFAACISGAGHSDIVQAYFSYNFNFHTPYYFQFENGIYNMPPFRENKELYEKNNPILYSEKISVPILLWAGMNDLNVPYQHSLNFFNALKRNNKDVILFLFKNAGHDLKADSQDAKNLHLKMLEWWDYFLKDKQNIPWINLQIKKGAY